jgi:energy-coupling factor transporter transmembrane protein EcfT
MYLIMLILLPIVLFIVFYIWLRKIGKAFVWSSLISMVVVIIFGVIIYFDAKQFSEKFPTEPKLFLFDENNQIVGGLIIRNFNFTTDENGMPIFEYLLDDNIASINKAYEARDYKTMLGPNYEIYIFKSKVFDGIKSDVPINDMLAAYKAQYTTMVYLSKFGTLMNEKGPIIIIKEFTKGNIIIYPETVMFQVTKEIPPAVFDKVSEKMVAMENSQEEK